MYVCTSIFVQSSSFLKFVSLFTEICKPLFWHNDVCNHTMLYNSCKGCQLHRKVHKCCAVTQHLANQTNKCIIADISIYAVIRNTSIYSDNQHIDQHKYRNSQSQHRVSFINQMTSDFNLTSG